MVGAPALKLPPVPKDVRWLEKQKRQAKKKAKEAKHKAKGATGDASRGLFAIPKRDLARSKRKYDSIWRMNCFIISEGLESHEWHFQINLASFFNFISSMSRYKLEIHDFLSGASPRTPISLKARFACLPFLQRGIGGETFFPRWPLEKK